MAAQRQRARCRAKRAQGLSHHAPRAAAQGGVGGQDGDASRRNLLLDRRRGSGGRRGRGNRLSRDRCGVRFGDSPADRSHPSRRDAARRAMAGAIRAVMTSIGEKFNGIGMTSTRTRTRMVERLREQGIKDEAVLAAMAAVPRHIFVEDALAIRAYDDSPLPIGAGQTISQPYVVARMTELLRAGAPLRRVLEIGTGCGYQTAILAQIAEEVYTVERIGSLVAKARRNLRALKANSVRIKHGDGSADLGEDLEVDGIMVTAAATQVPTSLL